jgi:hypothetical protein|tara:strand:- start:1347 stop:1832 length:486 start_codon:yes stop_codon:yes gene_type:complete
MSRDIIATIKWLTVLLGALTALVAAFVLFWDEGRNAFDKVIADLSRPSLEDCQYFDTVKSGPAHIVPGGSVMKDMRIPALCTFTGTGGANDFRAGARGGEEISAGRQKGAAPNVVKDIIVYTSFVIRHHAGTEFGEQFEVMWHCSPHPPDICDRDGGDQKP